MPRSVIEAVTRFERRHGSCPGDPATVPCSTVDMLTTPDALRDRVRRMAPSAGVTVVTGPVERRLLALGPSGPGPWLLADLSGQPHDSRPWPAWAKDHLRVHDAHDWISWADVDRAGRERLNSPRVLLVGLYKPEIFPLPRFALGIHDLARAARAHLTGRIRLMDMQLGATREDILTALGDQGEAVDVLGLSATFGQHDLLTDILDAVHALPRPPMILAGGSLSARNEQVLLSAYPDVLVGRAAGEPMITDVLDHWHGELDVSGIRFAGHSHHRSSTPTSVTLSRRPSIVVTEDLGHGLPELDLLDATLAAGGVAQLETSRGCTSACSFCPRGHKGSWHGTVPAGMPEVLHRMRRTFDRHAGTARVLYLVDEEFIGEGVDPIARAMDVAGTVHRAGFRWETSCRIDQVVRADADRTWHVRRAGMWKDLLELGLRRCLFGVESGVDSVLERFAKGTVAEQNVLAARTLSLLGVATRFTYITFDPLMTLSELVATHAFQARTDLLLRPDPTLCPDDIVDAVRDPAYVAAHRTGRPFYTEIPYMLVSMECLTGSAYTRRVQRAGLAGPVEPAMGRLHARYRDWRIGVASRCAQRWIDHNFVLDYTLKSLEKTMDGPLRRAVRETRTVIKDEAFVVLGDMIKILATYPPELARPADLETDLVTLLDRHVAALTPLLRDTLAALTPDLPSPARQTLLGEHRRWLSRTGWELINSAR